MDAYKYTENQIITLTCHRFLAIHQLC